MDALSAFFPSMPNDKSSSSSSFYAQWSSKLVIGLSEDTLISSVSLGIAASLCLWWIVYNFPEGLLSVPSEVCSSDIGLLSLVPALEYSSSHKYYLFVHYSALWCPKIPLSIDIIFIAFFKLIL